MNALTTKPKPLPNLTAIRLFAAGLVLATHLVEGKDFSPHNLLLPFAEQGYTGVSIFFVLSGFVLAYNHVTVTHRLRFYIARFARVYPLYLFALLWMVVFQLNVAHRMHDLSRLGPLALLASVFMVQTWFPSIALAFNTPGWTLCVEAFFYLLFPLLLPFVTRRLHHRWRWMAAIWILFLIPPVLVDYGAGWFGYSVPANANIALHAILIIPLFRVGEFMLGMFAGAQFRRKPRTFPSWQVALAAIVCTVTIYFSTHLAFEVMRNDAMGLIYAAFLTMLAGWRSPLLEAWPMQLGGEISYGIYLLQYPLMVTFIGIGKRSGFHHWKLEVLFAAPVLAFLTYTYIEKPARRAILNHFKIRSTAKPLPTPTAIP